MITGGSASWPSSHTKDESYLEGGGEGGGGEGGGGEGVRFFHQFGSKSISPTPGHLSFYLLPGYIFMRLGLDY